MVSLFFNQTVPFFGVELFSHDISVSALCLVVGVFVDTDHVIDYRLSKGHVGSLESRFRNGRMYVVFYGIENIIVLAGLSLVFPFLVLPTVSYLCHMTMDVYGNGVPFQAYSYTIRFGRKFTHNIGHIG
jgi:hypothetical protein